MNVTEIFKNSIKYPFNNIQLMLLLGIICLLTGIARILEIFTDNYIIGIIAAIVGILFFFVLRGYSLDINKKGILKSDELPSFDIVTQFIKGIKLLILDIIYFLIPIIVIVILTFVLKIPQLMQTIKTTAIVNGTVIPSAVSAATKTNFFTAIGIIVFVALVLFIIFGLLEIMGKCRLAKTDDLWESLNFKQSYQDLRNIGIINTILILILIAIIAFIVGLIIGVITMLCGFAGTAGIVIAFIIDAVIFTSYLTLFSEYATGLLYSNLE